MSPVHNILYPTDFSMTAEEAFGHARLLAAQCDAVVHALHVFDAPEVPVLIDTGEHLEKLREENNLLMRTLQDRAQVEDPSITLKAEIVERTSTSVAEYILAYIDANEIDLIVMGMHGQKGPDGLLMGSVAEAVVREAPCPTLVVKASSPVHQEGSAAERSRTPRTPSASNEHQMT